MELRRLSVEQIVELYDRHLKYDFPEDELKPIGRITDMYDRGVYFAAGMYDEENVLRAYAYFVHDAVEMTVLLDYFAVVRGNRDKGYGSKFWENAGAFLKEYDIDRLYLETENIDFAKDDEDMNTRIRRIAFYKKNGLTMTDVRSMLFGVNYNIMMLELNKDNDATGISDTDTVRQQLKNIYNIMFEEEKFKDKVIIYE